MPPADSVLPASGTQYRLESGDYRAEIASVGASLRALTHRGRDLVLPYGADEVRPRYRGAVLAPWPNRVGAGRWTWRGSEQQLAINEPEHDSALHGLVLWLDWPAVEIEPARVVLSTRIWPQPGYPFALGLQMTWALAADGLTGTLAATNVGTSPAPYGCGIHPYLLAAPDGVVDDWTLLLPAAQRLEVDDRMLPAAAATAPPGAADFRTARRIGDTAIDNAYGDIQFAAANGDIQFADGTAAALLVDPAGNGVRMDFGARTPWVQLHTADRPDDPGLNRRGLAVEPMTCPPNAFVSGTDLAVLEPGTSTAAWWRISAV